MDPIFAKMLSGHPTDLLNKIIRFEISTFKTVAIIAFTDAYSPPWGGGHYDLLKRYMAFLKACFSLLINTRIPNNIMTTTRL